MNDMIEPTAVGTMIFAKVNASDQREPLVRTFNPDQPWQRLARHDVGAGDRWAADHSWDELSGVILVFDAPLNVQPRALPEFCQHPKGPNAGTVPPCLRTLNVEGRCPVHSADVHPQEPARV